MKQGQIQLMHLPTLNTVMMVVKVLMESWGGIIKISELKRRLPKQVMHSTLIGILDYLQESGKKFL